MSVGIYGIKGSGDSDEVNMYLLKSDLNWCDPWHYMFRRHFDVLHVNLMLSVDTEGFTLQLCLNYRPPDDDCESRFFNISDALCRVRLYLANWDMESLTAIISSWRAVWSYRNHLEVRRWLVAQSWSDGLVAEVFLGFSQL